MKEIVCVIAFFIIIKKKTHIVFKCICIYVYKMCNILLQIFLVNVEPRIFDWFKTVQSESILNTICL